MSLADFRGQPRVLPWRRAPLPSAPGGLLSLREDLDDRLVRLLDEPRGVSHGELGWTPAANAHETDDLVVTVRFRRIPIHT